MARPIARGLLSAGASVALHAIVVAVVVGSQAFSGLSMPKIETIEITTVPTEPPKDLPLGAAPAEGGAAKPARAGGKPRPTAPGVGELAAARPGADAGTKREGPDAGAASDRDAGAAKREGRDGGRKAPDLREVGPAGSRLTALVRLDRLREGPHAALYSSALDDLLRFLPDRRRLIDGSGLDLYRDFDTLLIATPNPTDETVTFLAVRHHLSEATLRAGIDRASVAAGRPLAWNEQRGRPYATRTAAAPGAPAAFARDDRLILLPAPHLAVLATPAYAKLLLDGRDFRVLARRLAAEEEAMPDDAVFVMVASNLLGGGAGGVDDDALPVGVGNLPPFETATLTSATAPEPSLSVKLDFKTERAATKWATFLPTMRAQLLNNPLVAFGGFTALLSRVTIDREISTVVVHAKATPDETVRLLKLVATFARRGF